jgi:hypothetical protein
VGKWLNEEYPKIAAKAKAEGAEIQWGDETGLHSDDVRGRGYVAQRADSRRSCQRAARETQRDLDGHQQVPDALEGLLGSAERQGSDRFFGSAGAPMLGSGFIVPISCPDFTVTLIAKHS